MNSRITMGLCLSGLALLLLAAWGPAANYPFVNFDDPNVIVENEVIEGLSGDHLKAILTERRDHAYLPVYYLSFLLDHAIAQKRPWIYHTLNLVIHFSGAVLLLLLLRRWGVSLWQGGLGVAFFLIHPAATESVIWASGRKDVLSGFLMLLAFLLWWPRDGKEQGRKALWGGALAFLAALFTKASVMTLPVFLFLALRLLRHGEEENRAPGRRALQVAGVLTVMSVAIHLMVARSSGTASLAPVNLFDQAAVMLGALARYVVNALAPVSLSLVYHRPATSGMDPWAWGGAALLLVLFFVLRRYWRKPSLMGLGTLWFFAGLIPFNNIFPRFAGVMADRYLYLSLMGLAIGIAGAAQWLKRQGWFRPGILILLLYLGALFHLSRQRVLVWHDSETLWKDALSHAEGAMLPYLQLGQVYEERALEAAPAKAARVLDDAARLFARGLRVAAGPREKAQALLKLASLEARRGRFRNALDAYEQLDRVLPETLSPEEQDALDHALVTRASALVGLGRLGEALETLRPIDSSSVADREARHTRALIAILEANAALERAKTDEGQAQAIAMYNRGLALYQELIELWPRDEAARHDHVKAFMRATWLKDYEIEVTKVTNALVEDFPESGLARYLRARALRGADPALALQDLKASLTLDPYREEAYLMLVELYRGAGQNKVAKLVIDRGLHYLPDSARLKEALCETWVSFGYHHKNTGKLDLAAEAADRARSILPESPAAWELTAEVAEAAAGMTKNADLKRELWEDANRAWEKLEELDPKNRASRLGRARYHRVRGYSYLYTTLPKDLSPETRRTQRAAIRRAAMDEFLEALNLAPGAEEVEGVQTLLRNYAAEFRARAEDLLELGETARADVELEKAMTYDPGSAENQALRGRIAAAAMNFDRAEAAFESCLKRDPDHLRTLFELGKLRWEARNYSGAIKPLERFCRLTDGAVMPTLKKVRQSAEALLQLCRKKAKEGEKK